MNNQYPYQMFDPNYLAYMQQQQQFFHEQQLREVHDAAKDLSSFIESASRIAPEYQNYAMFVFVGIVLEHMSRTRTI